MRPSSAGEMPAFTCSSLTFQDLESCRLRLDPELDRHRYERKISFAGVLDENEDSKDSLHSSSHTLKSDAGVEEKKGMEKQQFFSCFRVPHRIFGLGSKLQNCAPREVQNRWLGTALCPRGRKPHCLWVRRCSQRCSRSNSSSRTLHVLLSLRCHESLDGPLFYVAIKEEKYSQFSSSVIPSYHSVCILFLLKEDFQTSLDVDFYQYISFLCSQKKGKYK